MKYSFLIPYYDRGVQFENTLHSYKKLYGHRSDWEVVVVEDVKCARDKNMHHDLVTKILASGVNVSLVQAISETPNPCSRFNQAAEEANGWIFILTNPECYHVTDVLAVFDEEFNYKKRPYVIAACESVQNFKRNGKGINYKHHMWYHHSELRHTGYHFCTAITKKDFVRVGGFDEDYAHGIAYDDNDFRDVVFASGMEIIYRDDALVLHQKHARHHGALPNYRVLLKRNEKLYSRKRAERKGAEC